MCLTVIGKIRTCRRAFYTVKFSRTANYRGYQPGNDNFLSWFRGAPQSLNSILREEIAQNLVEGYWGSQGLHSVNLLAKELPWTSTMYTERLGYESVAILCKIPKGAKYYTGRDCDIMSDSIELVNVVAAGSIVPGWDKIGGDTYNLTFCREIRKIVRQYALDMGYNTIPS
jgi:hypothetical protein